MSDDDWFQTTGGPAIMLSYSTWQRWNRSSDDYLAACEIDKFLGTKTLHGCDVLIFGGGIFPLFVFYRNTEVCIARWCFAANDEAALAAVSNCELGASIETMDWNTSGESYFLIDASMDFDYGHSRAEQFRRIGTLSGLFRVTTHQIRPDDETDLLVHVFHKLLKD